MNFIKPLLFFWLGLFQFIPAFTQAHTVRNRELEVENWFDASLNLKSDGVLIYGRENRTTIALKLIDTALNEKNDWTIDCTNFSSLSDVEYYENGHQVLVLTWVEQRKYSLNKLDLATNKLTSTEFEIPIRISFRKEMFIVGDEVWMIGSAPKGYMLFRMNIATSDLRLEKLEFDESHCLIKDVIPMDKGEVAVTYLYGSMFKKELNVAILDSNGNFMEKSLLSGFTKLERQGLIDASVTRLGDGDYALTGTYNKKGKSIGNGVYFARYVNNKLRYVSHFDYSDFEHFFDYLKDKSKEKTNAKIDKKKSKGKDVTINYRAVSHEALVSDNGLVFVSEYFYPTYRSEIVSSGSGTSTQKVFDGFQYTHAMAVGIDQDGKKIYDLHIPLKVWGTPMTAQKYLRMSSDTTTQYFVHTYGRKILSSEITGNHITNHEFEVTNKIPEKEKEKWSMSNGMYWYDSYFFIMETQKTKEKGMGGKSKIKFHISKVEML